MEKIINKIFKEKYPNGLSCEFTKEEMIGYMCAINDIKEQYPIHGVVVPKDTLKTNKGKCPCKMPFSQTWCEEHERWT
jgi:hypothetical protein